MIVKGIDVVHWNPPRPIARGRLGLALPKLGATRNFGDMLGPFAVARLSPEMLAPVRRRLLTVGSIMHFAADGDVVWGTGVNGKVPLSEITARELDVRAVRGPRTAEVLSRLGVHVPAVFGDPGLLIPGLLGMTRDTSPRIEVTSLPNLRDHRRWRGRPGLLSPRTDFQTVVRTIAASSQVVTSSLHGLVISDALRVPVSFVRPVEEDLFKYEDYYEGTGRSLPHVNTSFRGAMSNTAPSLEWDPSALLEAFPSDLWSMAQPPGDR